VAEDKEKKKARDKRYRKAHPERIRARVIASTKAWREANREKIRAYLKAYRARKALATDVPPSSSDRSSGV
jgi:ABC-type nitrate/sulfonate/bicarbonate transport system substrate-binding protein